MAATLQGPHMPAPGSTDAAAFRLPPEDAPHRRTLMQWPVDRHVYPHASALETVQATVADIANAIAAFEPVAMLADRAAHAGARARLSEAVELWDIATDDLWCRDSGPIFVVDPGGAMAVSHIRFDGWGGKQRGRNDRRVAPRVAERLGLPLLRSGLCGEGGGVEQDGDGLLIAHESSWLGGRRNAGQSRDEIEARLLGALGAERVIWSAGVAGRDITDYHIDGLARFTAPGRVLIALADAPDRADPFHRAALATHDALVAAGLDVEVIPEPRRPRATSRDFVASYANFYVCNGGVIAPRFGDRETDAIAAAALARHYPGREVVTLDIDPLGHLGGGIHCATREMPAARAGA